MIWVSTQVVVLSLFLSLHHVSRLQNYYQIKHLFFVLSNTISPPPKGGNDSMNNVCLRLKVVLGIKNWGALKPILNNAKSVFIGEQVKIPFQYAVFFLSYLKEKKSTGCDVNPNVFRMVGEMLIELFKCYSQASVSFSLHSRKNQYSNLVFNDHKYSSFVLAVSLSLSVTIKM